MQRRQFIHLSLAGAGAAMASPALVSAENRNAAKLPAGADLYYTKESAGRWAAKINSHLPFIEIEKNGAEIKVKVSTAHEMKAYEHYIVKHVLLDQNLKFIDEHLFDPSKDSLASSSFTLKNYSGVLYAVSMCNKHDVWLESIEV